MNKKYHLLFALIIALPLLISTVPVHADVAPPHAVAVGGLQSSDAQPTNVQMTFERVELEILEMPPEPDATKRYSNRQVAVNAWFILHNTGNTEEKMQVVFPLSDFNDFRSNVTYIQRGYMKLNIDRESFRATVDGVPATIVDVGDKNAEKSAVTGEYFHWAGFDVTFPVDQDVMVRVSYQMDNFNEIYDSMSFGDSIESFEYILETGGGWKGPISKGSVVVRFPYVVEDNILEKTTPGYQKQDNEISWHFENLEPTAKNNIAIAFVEPSMWRKIRSYRKQVTNNPSDVETWLQLARTYEGIGYINGSRTRDGGYIGQAVETYERALQLNPNSPELYVAYARFYWMRNSIMSLDPQVSQLLEKALSLDPSNVEALAMVEKLKIALTPPPTFTPSLTPKISATPKATLTPSATPLPFTRYTATDIPTRTATLIPSPLPSQTSTRGVTLEPTRQPTATVEVLPVSTIPAPVDTGQTNLIGWIAGALLGVAAIGLAIFWRKRRM